MSQDVGDKHCLAGLEYNHSGGDYGDEVPTGLNEPLT